MHERPRLKGCPCVRVWWNRMNARNTGLPCAQSLAIPRLLGYSGHVRADTLGGNTDEAPPISRSRRRLMFLGTDANEPGKQPLLEPRKEMP
jgi:hypothetical protein